MKEDVKEMRKVKTLMFVGIIFGGVGALRMGLRGGELIQTVGKTALQGGGTFGTFMAIGTGIRC